MRSFLTSRGIEADEATVKRLGDRKNELVLEIIERDGVEAYDGSVRYLHAAKDAGRKLAVVSSSANAKEVLEGGRDPRPLRPHCRRPRGRRRRAEGQARAGHVPGGAPRRLACEPAHAAVFEDALAGVEAGRAGRFGVVVGVDRVGQADALAQHGATIVVQDLAELLP